MSGEICHCVPEYLQSCALCEPVESGETLQEKIAKLLGTHGDLDVSKFKPSGRGTMVIGGCCVREDVPKDIEINVDPPSASEAKEISAKIWEEFEGSFREAWERQAKEKGSE